MKGIDINTTKNKTTEPREEPGLWHIIFEGLHSLKLTIFLLILLALVSIMGTVIPQNRPASEYLTVYSLVKYRIYLALGLLDMYHSWWFIGLLTLLGMNLTACSLRRLPGVLRQISDPPPLLTDSLAQSCGLRQSLLVAHPVEKCRAVAESVLRGRYRCTRVEEVENVHHQAWDRGRYARLGVLITHASVLIILLGGLVGSIFGFKGYVNIVEGGSVDRVFLQKSMTPVSLGFTVRCDDFQVSFYNDGTPRDYRSTITILEDGKEALRQDIRVNHPLVYKGITFYQSSYGDAGEPTFDIEIKNREKGQAQVTTVEFQKKVPLEQGDGAFMVEDYRESVMGGGPAVRIARFEGARRTGAFWAVAGSPTTVDMDGTTWSFLLKAAHQRQYTGLQVSRDPGTWLVWIGCILLVGGMLVALFMAHWRIWIRITPEKEGSRILLAGRGTRNPLSFRKDFEKLAEAFARMSSGGSGPQKKRAREQL